MGDDTSPATLPPSVSLKQIEGLVLKELRSLGTLNDARRVRVNVRSKLMSGNPNRLRSRDGSTGASGDAVNAAEHALSAKEADLHSRAEQLRKATEREETRLTALERAAHSKLDHLKTQVLSTLARQADRFVLLRAFAKWQAYRARSAETRREKTLGQEGERARQRNAEQLALLQAQREMGETERRRLEEKVKEQDAAREEFRLRYEKRRGMEGQLEQQQQWELLGQRRQQILQQEVDGECNKQAANGTAANGSRRDSTEISQQNPGRKRSSTGKHQRLVLDLLQNMCDKICGVNSPMHPQKIFINISPDVANEVRRTRSASASQRSVVVPGWRADVSESQETSLERESPDECISVSPALHVSLHSPLPTTPDNPRTMRTDTSRFGIGIARGGEANHSKTHTDVDEEAGGLFKRHTKADGLGEHHRVPGAGRQDANTATRHVRGLSHARPGIHSAREEEAYHGETQTGVEHKIDGSPFVRHTGADRFSEGHRVPGAGCQDENTAARHVLDPSRAHPGIRIVHEGEAYHGETHNSVETKVDGSFVASDKAGRQDVNTATTNVRGLSHARPGKRIAREGEAKYGETHTSVEHEVDRSFVRHTGADRFSEGHRVPGAGCQDENTVARHVLDPSRAHPGIRIAREGEAYHSETHISVENKVDGSFVRHTEADRLNKVRRAGCQDENTAAGHVRGLSHARPGIRIAPEGEVHHGETHVSVESEVDGLFIRHTGANRFSEAHQVSRAGCQDENAAARHVLNLSQVRPGIRIVREGEAYHGETHTSVETEVDGSFVRHTGADRFSEVPRARCQDENAAVRRVLDLSQVRPGIRVEPKGEAYHGETHTSVEREVDSPLTLHPGKGADHQKKDTARHMRDQAKTAEKDEAPYFSETARLPCDSTEFAADSGQDRGQRRRPETRRTTVRGGTRRHNHETRDAGRCLVRPPPEPIWRPGGHTRSSAAKMQPKMTHEHPGGAVPSSFHRATVSKPQIRQPLHSAPDRLTVSLPWLLVVHVRESASKYVVSAFLHNAGKDRITHASAYEGPATGLKTFILEALHCFSRRWRVSLEDASVCFLVEEPCASQRFNAQAEVFMEATLGTMRAGSLCVISVVELVLRSRGMRDPVLVVSQHPDGSDLVVTAFKNFAPQSRAFAFGNARSTRSRCEQFVGSAAITSCLLELSPDDAAIALRRVVLLHLPHESAAVLDVDPGAHVVSFPTVNAVLSEAMVFLLDRPLDVTWMAALERVQLPYRHH